MKTPQCRRYKVFHYQPVDRVPDVEFGLWPQTVRRWLAEGLPAEAAKAVARHGAAKVFETYFGYLDGDKPEDDRFNIPIAYDINPPFETEILHSDAHCRIVRRRNGVLCREFAPDGEATSIPQYLEFPVKNAGDWEQMLRRYRLDDPFRIMSAETVRDLRAAAAAGRMISAYAPGFYGQLRNWAGTENLSLMFYDSPALVEKMLAHWTDLILHSLRQIPADVPLHEFDMWEDMCFNHGPLLSPDMFRRFIVPCYECIAEEISHRGCKIWVVDCDGRIELLIPDWLKVGINVMFPFEVAAGNDMSALRRQYGPQLRFCGGIDKRALIKGPDAIDRELERIAPMLSAGGYIPHVDHLVPADVALEHFLYYRRRKCELIGKKLELGRLP